MAEDQRSLEIEAIYLLNGPSPFLVPFGLSQGKAEDLDVLREFGGAVGARHEFPARKLRALRTERQPFFFRAQPRCALLMVDRAESVNGPASRADDLVLREVESSPRPAFAMLHRSRPG